MAPRRGPTALLAALVALTASVPGRAEDAALRARLPIAFKGTAAASRIRGPLAPVDRFDAASSWRLRAEPTLNTETVSLDLAYELVLELSDGPVEPPEAPFRVEDLRPVLAHGDHGVLRQELDRAALSVRLAAFTLTAGRQAVGWGRATLFRPADLLVPFSPLEFDRDWRRGIDALRAELRLDASASAELVLAGARRTEDLALLGRLRGVQGAVDYEVLGGRRLDDWVFGATVSAALFGAELHGEGLVHLLAKPWPLGGAWSDGHTVGVFTVGGSYTFDVGNGLTVLAELHGSGFGAADAAALRLFRADPRVARWLALGSAQVPGRFAAGAVVSYVLGLTTSASVAAIADPFDASGMVALSLTWDVADPVRLMATGYLPFGAPASRLSTGSFYGSSPGMLLVQLRVDEDPLAPR